MADKNRGICSDEQTGDNFQVTGGVFNNGSEPCGTHCILAKIVMQKIEKYHDLEDRYNKSMLYHSKKIRKLHATVRVLREEIARLKGAALIYILYLFI